MRAHVTLVEVVPHAAGDASALTGQVFDYLKSANLEAPLTERYGDRLVFTINEAPAGFDRAFRDALAWAGDIKVRGSLATVVLVGEDLAAQAATGAEAAAALRNVPVHLTVRPAGGRALAFVVDEANAVTAVRLLHDVFFPLEARAVPAGPDAVRA